MACAQNYMEQIFSLVIYTRYTFCNLLRIDIDILLQIQIEYGILVRLRYSSWIHFGLQI